MRRDFHIIATYTNTYNAAMHNSNNTVIIAQFLSSNLSHMIKQNKIFYAGIIMCTEGIVVKCQLMPLIVPQSICPSTSNQHPNQTSINTQLTIFYFNNICCKSKDVHHMWRSNKTYTKEKKLSDTWLTLDQHWVNSQQSVHRLICFDWKCQFLTKMSIEYQLSVNQNANGESIKGISKGYQ